MKPLSIVLPTALAQANPNDSSKPSLTTQSQSLTLHQDQEGVKALSNLLAQCFDIFPLYGREPEAAANIRKAFRLTLSDYPIAKIEDAFRWHLKHFREFPVPADIVHIIERGNKPPFERSVYITASKKHPEDRTAGDWEYMREYERWIQTGKN